MARVVGVDLPRDKRVEAGLQSIFGIGLTKAKEVLAVTGISPDTRVRDLTDEQVSTITAKVQEMKVEGDLRREITGNIKRLMDINCYRGVRHKRGLPVRGQRTSTNARTRKGPRRVAVKKKIGGRDTWLLINEKAESARRCSMSHRASPILRLRSITLSCPLPICKVMWSLGAAQDRLDL